MNYNTCLFIRGDFNNFFTPCFVQLCERRAVSINDTKRGSGTSCMLSYLEQDVAEPLPQSGVLVPNQPHGLHGAALLEVASQSQLVDLWRHKHGRSVAAQTSETRRQLCRDSPNDRFPTKMERLWSCCKTTTTKTSGSRTLSRFWSRSLTAGDLLTSRRPLCPLGCGNRSRSPPRSCQPRQTRQPDDASTLRATVCLPFG